MASFIEWPFALDTSGERAKTAMIVAIALGLFLGDAATAVSAVGIYAILASHRQALSIFVLLIPLSLLLDAGGLFKHRKGLGALCRLLLLAAKAAATYYAIDWLKATDQGAEPGPEGPVIYRPFAQADPVEESANASARFDPPQTTQVPSSSAGVQGGSAAAAEEGRATVTAAAAPTNLI